MTEFQVALNTEHDAFMGLFCLVERHLGGKMPDDVGQAFLRADDARSRTDRLRGKQKIEATAIIRCHRVELETGRRPVLAEVICSVEKEVEAVQRSRHPCPDRN